jgi:hypothetical protein
MSSRKPIRAAHRLRHYQNTYDAQNRLTRRSIPDRLRASQPGHRNHLRRPRQSRRTPRCPRTSGPPSLRRSKPPRRCRPTRRFISQRQNSARDIRLRRRRQSARPPGTRWRRGLHHSLRLRRPRSPRQSHRRRRSGLLLDLRSVGQSPGERYSVRSHHLHLRRPQPAPRHPRHHRSRNPPHGVSRHHLRDPPP